MVDEAALDHRIGGGFHLVGGNRCGETVPTVPAHRRRERDLVAADDAEFFLRRAERFFARSVTMCSPFIFKRAGDAACGWIELQSLAEDSVAENVIGRSPVAAMVNRNGDPGRTPKTFAPLMRGVAGAGGVRM